MNGYIKAMCMKLTELALETEDIFVSITRFGISVNHFSNGIAPYFDSISFKFDIDAEKRIEKALDYVKSLGGN